MGDPVRMQELCVDDRQKTTMNEPPPMDDPNTASYPRLVTQTAGSANLTLGLSNTRTAPVTSSQVSPVSFTCNFNTWFTDARGNSGHWQRLACNKVKREPLAAAP